MVREHENPFLKCKWGIKKTMQRGQDEGINSAHKLVIECVDVLMKKMKPFYLPWWEVTGGGEQSGLEA
jgi:hypothetical protein